MSWSREPIIIEASVGDTQVRDSSVCTYTKPELKLVYVAYPVLRHFAIQAHGQGVRYGDSHNRSLFGSRS